MLFFANSINKACAKGKMAKKADKLAEMYDKKKGVKRQRIIFLSLFCFLTPDYSLEHLIYNKV